MGSCIGATGADAAWGAGKDAAMAAAIEVAICRVRCEGEEEEKRVIGHPSAHITGNEISKCSPMSSSRTARLYVLLALDLVFFFLEISIGTVSRSLQMFPLLMHPPPGYAVGSLALVADSFHMLKYVKPPSSWHSTSSYTLQRCSELNNSTICHQGQLSLPIRIAQAR